MGRPFTETEIDLIRQKLMDSGRILFAKKDLKKTTIADLTASVNIAQGSFYAFYDSKEALYFEILENEEKLLAEKIKDTLAETNLTKVEFKLWLEQLIAALFENPFLHQMLDKEIYNTVMSKIPEQRFRQHLQEENAFICKLAEKYQASNELISINPQIISGLVYVFFLCQMHRSEIGEDIFPQLYDFLLNIVCDSLMIKGTSNLELPVE